MRFFHIIKQRKRGRKITALGLTVGVSISDAQDGIWDIMCAVSYCAPVEKRFSRPRGRLIAAERIRALAAMPAQKRFAFSTNTLDGLKYQVLSRLQKVVTIKWARQVVTKEVDKMEIRWLLRNERRAKVVETSDQAKKTKGNGVKYAGGKEALSIQPDYRI